MKQPNILVVMADQLPPHFTGAYGHPVSTHTGFDDQPARRADMTGHALHHFHGLVHDSYPATTG